MKHKNLQFSFGQKQFVYINDESLFKSTTRKVLVSYIYMYI